MRITGTATVVVAERVVVFLNHVDVRASRAKFGNRFASMFPSARNRSLTGNSSKRRYTTGVEDSTVAAEALTALGKTSSSTFELNRNVPRKIRDAPERIVRNVRTIGTRHAASATASPIATAPAMSRNAVSTPLRFSAWTPKTAASAPRNT